MIEAIVIKCRRPLIVGFHIGTDRGRQLSGFLDQIRWRDHRSSEITFRGDDTLARRDPRADFRSASALQRTLALHGDLGSSERHCRRDRKHGLILHSRALDLRPQRLSSVDFYHRLSAADFSYGRTAFGPSPLSCSEAGRSRQADSDLWGGGCRRDDRSGDKK